ncbi:hypothetical protein BDFB_005710 [Asbolus verrucosus]|uniref:Uncharacterized protein n=1 Tax=Asbolus verrucosus TaxID=1661398 RepID=A0A482W973_ASBVE|nr:hypothetical protein BDFB_005710 [Asbolus verrucosus]
MAKKLKEFENTLSVPVLRSFNCMRMIFLNEKDFVNDFWATFDDNLLQTTFFTDEAWFHLNGILENCGYRLLIAAVELLDHTFSMVTVFNFYYLLVNDLNIFLGSINAVSMRAPMDNLEELQDIIRNKITEIDKIVGL